MINVNTLRFYTIDIQNRLLRNLSFKFGTAIVYFLYFCAWKSRIFKYYITFLVRIREEHIQNNVENE
jgi:hypothetical protein